MRKLLRALLVVSGLVFITLTLWSVYILNTAGSPARPVKILNSKESSVFHFIALVPSPERDLFYLRMLNGMKERAEKDRVAVQTFEYRQGEGPESIRRQLRMIADIKPDGAALALPAGHAYDEAIAAIEGRGVPVITVEIDQPSSRRSAHIGTNSFELGKTAGAFAARRFPKGIDVALALTAPDASFVMGFKQGAGRSPNIGVPIIRTRREGAAVGEELVRELLTSQSSVRAIVFTQARDAESAAQAIVEYGRVGTLSLIAVDDTPEIRKFIAAGVISASVSRKPEETGAAAIETLRTLAGGERTNAYIDTGVTLLTQDTLEAERRK